MNRRIAIHLGLFLLTFFTTTVVGTGLALSFDRNQPVNLAQDADVLSAISHSPGILLHGLPFSIALLVILMAHEMGHYLTCRYYRIDASLPFFLPAPTLIGTMGAFIRIRSPIYTRRQLFDVGIAGPLAGFVFLVPALAIGMALSRVAPGIAARGDFVFGTPAILRIFEWLFFPGIPAADVYLHPIARAAWAGLLATALNLLPIGQLDGGHILYAIAGDKHRPLSLLFIAALIPLGVFYWWSWLVWAGLLFLFGRKHPVIFDLSPLDSTRRRLGCLALAIFLLSFTLIPIRAGA